MRSLFLFYLDTCIDFYIILYSDHPNGLQNAAKFERSTMLNNLNEIIATDYDNINGIVVMKNNKLIYEDYLGDVLPSDSIHIARDLNLVVAITSSFKARYKDRIKLIEEHIVPYLK